MGLRYPISVDLLTRFAAVSFMDLARRCVG